MLPHVRLRVAHCDRQERWQYHFWAKDVCVLNMNGMNKLDICNFNDTISDGNVKFHKKEYTPSYPLK